MFTVAIGIPMPFSADAIANYFLNLAQAAERPLTQMQIQKLAFYSHGWYLALDELGRPLIGESVEAWQFGPVFRSLYREFKEFGNRPIDRSAREMSLVKNPEGKLKFSIVIPTVESESPGDVDASLAFAVLNRVWEMYGRFTAYQLSNMTHAEGEPWRIIREAMPNPIPKGLHIPNETIRECFKAKLRPA